MAPVKCSIFPLSSSQALVAQAEQISKSLKKLGFSTKIDTTSVTIGRRYDEWMNREWIDMLVPMRLVFPSPSLSILIRLRRTALCLRLWLSVREIRCSRYELERDVDDDSRFVFLSRILFPLWPIWSTERRPGSMSLRCIPRLRSRIRNKSPILGCCLFVDISLLLLSFESNTMKDEYCEWLFNRIRTKKEKTNVFSKEWNFYGVFINLLNCIPRRPIRWKNWNCVPSKNECSFLSI